MLNTVYLLIFLVGAIGFVAMTAMGALHAVGGIQHGHAGGAAGHAPVGHNSVGHSALGHGSVGPGSGNHGANGSAASSGHTPAGMAPRTAPRIVQGVARGANHGQAHGGGSTDQGSRVDSAHPLGAQTGASTATASGGSLAKVLLLISPLDIFSICLGMGAVGVLLHTVIPSSWMLAASILAGLVFDFGIIKPYMAYLLRFATKPSEGLEGTISQEAEAMTGFDASGRGLVRLVLDGQNIQLLATLDDLEKTKGIQVRKGERVLITEVDPKMNTCRVTRELAS